jgi:hypothetical protein
VTVCVLSSSSERTQAPPAGISCLGHFQSVTWSRDPPVGKKEKPRRLATGFFLDAAPRLTAAAMGKAQGWTDQCTTLLVYSIFAIIVGSYGAYEHEFERGSMHSLYAGVRPPRAAAA